MIFVEWLCLSLKRTFENFQQELTATGIYLITIKLYRVTERKMIVSVLKTHFRKLPPRVISYRDLSNYNANFIKSLNEVICEKNLF